MGTDKIQIVGVGSLGEALVTGVLSAKYIEPSQLVLVDKFLERAEKLAQTWPGIELTNEPQDIKTTFVAVRPVDLRDACENLGKILSPNSRVISTAAGVLIEQIESWLPKETRVLRIMPNLLMSVGSGQVAVAGGSAAKTADISWTTSFFNSCGVAVEVDESFFPAFTAGFGSGPGFLFYLAKSLKDAVVVQGISESDANNLVRELIYGTGKMLCNTTTGMEELLNEVVVPNGTTEAGLKVLNAKDVSGLIGSAVEAATKRSIEISKGN